MVQNTLSYWNQTSKKPEFPSLKQSIETDILIIGGGITGVTCAYCLASRGAKPVLIEAGGLCDGTTGNTTGKITAQHDILYSTLAKKYSLDVAAQYYNSQNSALTFVREQVEKLSIDCQLTQNTAYVYASKENDLKAVEDEYKTALKLGIDAVFFDAPEFPSMNFGMLGFKNQYAFHSVRYASALAQEAVSRGAEIFCSTKAIRLENENIKTVYCDNGVSIKAKHVVMATQYPFYDGPNLFYARLFPKRAYAIAVKPKKSWPDGSYVNVSDPSRSIRTHIEDGERVLIVVGEGHPTGRGDIDMDEHFHNLISFADNVAGIDRILAKWSAQDYETPDEIPYIGRLSDNTNIYVAAGYRKWGLSNGTLAGNMISELILSGSCNYEGLYSRARRDFLSSPLKTVSEILGFTGQLIKSKLEKTDDIVDLAKGEGRVIKFDGKRAGIYRDFDDTVIILNVSCTHMTTTLNFNSAEKTWDCPAHGGRFSTEGTLLEGPPKDPLEVLYKGNYQGLV